MLFRSSASGAAVTWSASSATDTGYAAGNITISYANASGTAVVSGDIFAIGTHTITATATDGSSNTHTCTFTVKVADTTNPAIACGAQNNANVDTSGNGTNDATEATSVSGAAVTWSASTATDTGYAAGNITIAYANASGTAVVSGGTFAIGTHTITATATDGSSNTHTCTFDVTVVDTTSPAITCAAAPASVEATSSAGVQVS